MTTAENDVAAATETKVDKAIDAGVAALEQVTLAKAPPGYSYILVRAEGEAAKALETFLDKEIPVVAKMIGDEIVELATEVKNDIVLWVRRFVSHFRKPPIVPDAVKALTNDDLRTLYRVVQTPIPDGAVIPLPSGAQWDAVSARENAENLAAEMGNRKLVL